jgi:hypothetical protein
MAKEIKYKDFNREMFENLDWYRSDADEQFKNTKIINIETFKDKIRFWFTNE